MDRRILVRMLALAPALLLVATPAPGQCEPELVETFMPDDPTNHFGFAVAIDGDVVVVGADYDDDAAPLGGALYVYRAAGDGWTFEQKLLASDAGELDKLGSAVAVSGDLIVAGAPGDNGFRGAVYVFERREGGWEQTAKLIAAGLDEYSQFGASVALAMGEDGPVIVAGAPADPGGDGFGAVHVYRHAGGEWEWDGEFAPLDRQQKDRFGAAVALSADRFVAGAYGHASNRGAAYVFAQGVNGWVEEAKLLPNDGFFGQLFGADVDLDAGTVLVGTSAYGEFGPLPGSAYIFDAMGGSWSQTAKLTPSDGMDEEFGIGVALEDGTAVVGALQGGPSAYVYAGMPGGWEEQSKLALPGLDTIRDLDLRERQAVLGGFYVGSGPVLLYQLCDIGCYADVDGDGDLTLFDFLAYVNLFNGNDGGADCDGSGVLDLFDFLCFVNGFNQGCQ